MNVEIIGTPVTRTSGNAASEKMKLLVTRDDGTTDIAETRAICMRVGDLTIEAFLTITEGKTYLALMTFQTVSVLPNGEVGKIVNRAVQDDEGNLDAVADEPMCVREQVFSTTEELLNFIAQQVQAVQTPQSGTSP
jgi:hypothetical protein